MSASSTSSPSRPLRDTFPFLLFKRRWILTTLLVIAASAVMVRLGFWQLDRLDQKRAYIAESLLEINAMPMDLTGNEVDLDAQAMRYRRATVSGEYDFGNEVVIKSKLYRDTPGYHLLTPMIIDGSERAVLIDRGWISVQSYDPATVAEYQEPNIQRVEGRIEPPARRPDGAEIPSGPQTEWYRVDVAALQEQVPYELLPFYVALTPGELNTELPYRNPPEIFLDEGPHMGYAIQWFLFALIVPIVYAAQVRRMDRKRQD